MSRASRTPFVRPWLRAGGCLLGMVPMLSLSTAITFGHGGFWTFTALPFAAASFHDSLHLLITGRSPKSAFLVVAELQKGRFKAHQDNRSSENT